MEKITNRDWYSNNFFEFCNKVQLNESFIEQLKNHRYFCDEMKTVLVRKLTLNKKIFSLIILSIKNSK